MVDDPLTEDANLSMRKNDGEKSTLLSMAVTNSDILIIDDDQLNIEAMRFLLMQFSLDAKFTMTGRGAIQLI